MCQHAVGTPKSTLVKDQQKLIFGIYCDKCGKLIRTLGEIPYVVPHLTPQPARPLS